MGSTGRLGEAGENELELSRQGRHITHGKITRRLGLAGSRCHGNSAALRLLPPIDDGAKTR